MDMSKIGFVFAFACFLSAPAVFGENNSTAKGTCCQQAAAQGKDCRHKCCLAAHREGKSCAKCNPSKEDLSLKKAIKATVTVKK